MKLYTYFRAFEISQKELYRLANMDWPDFSSIKDEKTWSKVKNRHFYLRDGLIRRMEQGEIELSKLRVLLDFHKEVAQNVLEINRLHHD